MRDEYVPLFPVYIRSLYHRFHGVLEAAFLYVRIELPYLYGLNIREQPYVKGARAVA